MAASNDLRGWVMSAVSGAACVLGSAVICVDILLRYVSRRKDFQIVHNNAFLSASLCLSAGVMLFTSLYSMLPTSHNYLIRAGWSPSSAAYVLIGLFLIGVVVIRFASALLHRYIPSHVVDCAHTHEPHSKLDHHHEHDEHHHEHPDGSHTWNERTPLLSRSFKSSPATMTLPGANFPTQPALQRRESLRDRLTRRFSRIVGVKAQCDENGPCFGFSQACGHECTKTLLSTPEVSDVGETDELVRPQLHQPRSITVHVVDSAQPNDLESGLPHHRHHHHEASSSSSRTSLLDEPCQPAEDDVPRKPSVSTTATQQHHHHVPQNAFLSIGLQTSVAIALHKLPEGFITYATNHASPTLGLTVFLALFIHNISEGFAMALPLYLALHSRGWAMFWSSLLGGISQPAGAGLAALWIWATRRANGDDAAGLSWGVYGGMFAATAGVMTSVALQLFSEGLTLTHHRGMCTGFAIGGMVLMGLSFALTA
ncbi:Zn(2+) transporter ZRT3 [Aspergillus homomorphus CBS 101889]|uniref:ZIP metal ion transporter n=1 Tax=Aspergillus homomorphus (strain CBS 101889) TaxID=1450537 RepID=A0A395IAF0_ASPHC|nr:hypothetical protein BO97DRAFT_476115 [Aspergillus homomorphus CBS 101889]RAL15134.1 hypothetical protein BO97DRAFT_476115 [Aspergillus homomorphus CBS 101889]